jgi:hypothetical protein
MVDPVCAVKYLGSWVASPLIVTMPCGPIWSNGFWLIHDPNKSQTPINHTNPHDWIPMSCPAWNHDTPICLSPLRWSIDARAFEDIHRWRAGMFWVLLRPVPTCGRSPGWKMKEIGAATWEAGIASSWFRGRVVQNMCCMTCCVDIPEIITVL